VSRLAKRAQVKVAWSGVVVMDAQVLRARVWRLLRIRRRLTTAEAVALLCDGDDSAQEIRRATGVVGRYLRYLRLAGYVVNLPAPSARGGTPYLLVRDTGAMSPVHLWSNTMSDPNNGMTYAFVA